MGKELFTNIPSKVKNLVDDVRIGKIGLSDLQRPFVWKDNKVRDLCDSMLRGYPIGYVMLWEAPSVGSHGVGGCMLYLCQVIFISADKIQHEKANLPSNIYQHHQKR